MDKKPCVRCSRMIDPVARLCPFCNWDQEMPAPRESPLVSAVAIEQAVEEKSSRRKEVAKRFLLYGGIAAVLLLTFVVGGVVYGLGKKAEDRPEDDQNPPVQRAAAQTPERVTDLRLVPAEDLTTTVGRSFTTAPETTTTVASDANDRSDTTALASAQYNQMAQRAEQERNAAPRPEDQRSTIDPREIAPPPARPAVQRPRPAVQPSSPGTEPASPVGERPVASNDPPMSTEDRAPVRRTRPEPVSQPLPDLNVQGTARFRLRVGADGSVKEVEVLRTIPGATSRLLGSIQRWRFKPATENGRPVEGIHLVDVSFNADNSEQEDNDRD